MVKLTVNGKAHTYDGDPEMPLLWYLRDDLRLTGTRFGCGAGLCGACTVHVNGVATRSCVTPVQAVRSKRVSTIERLSQSPIGRALQKAWLELDVVQCGYCQSGQLMSAAALLAKNPAPTDADIDAAMSGNICRCGTYIRIRQGIHAAAAGLAGAATKG